MMYFVGTMHPFEREERVGYQGEDHDRDSDRYEQ